ncbi:MAG TPA: hypothetical protein VJ651_16610 [Noviherbaspirillum sp.]|nr:hypothetical protein [Noviherbaspirillum sp.]
MSAAILIPAIPMLSGKGSGKVLLVVGVLVALAIASQRKTATTTNAGGK